MDTTRTMNNTDTFLNPSVLRFVDFTVFHVWVLPCVEVHVKNVKKKGIGAAAPVVAVRGKV